MNSWLLGFSGNDLHAYMDRYAKQYRQKHRDVGGHDLKALIQMIFLYGNKYNSFDILKTYVLHKYLDGTFSGFQSAVKKRNSGYGRKATIDEIIKKLKKEVFRL